MIIRDCTHFRTKDNLIFTTRGFYHPQNKIRAAGLCFADPKGDRKSRFFDKTFTRSIDEFGDIWLDKSKPEYIQSTTLGKVIFVPLADIVQIFDPFSLPRETKDEVSKTKFQPVLDALKKLGINDKDVGAIGSYLIGSQNGQSDIDILIRGVQNMRKIKANITTLRKSLNALGTLDDKRKSATLEKYSKVYSLHKNDFDSMISRRWSTIRIGDDIMLKLLFTYKPEEVPQNLLPKELIGDCHLKGRVIDDEGVCFMPRHFMLQTEKGKIRVLTYFWHFYWCVQTGDNVGVCGALSKDGKTLMLNDRRVHGIVHIKNGG